jgi:REP element-mobilizing transposase RayT
MARVARRDAPGAIHHVLLRAIEGRWIFLDDDDRYDFLERLARQITEGLGSCLGWTLMPNHVHLLLRTGERPLSEAMRRLNTGYARAFNLRHRRSGYLFQGRFPSILVEDDGYLRVVPRYIRLNPIRGKLLSSLDALARPPCRATKGLTSSADCREEEGKRQLRPRSLSIYRTESSPRSSLREDRSLHSIRLLAVLAWFPPRRW